MKRPISSIIIALWYFVFLVGCGLMPPRRQYLKEIKRQVVPRELLNTAWILESYDHKPPACDVQFNFLPKGQLTYTYQGVLHKGDHLYYLVKDSTIQLHMHPEEKFGWDCEVNPSMVALIVGGKTVKFTDQKMVFSATFNAGLVFKKI